MDYKYLKESLSEQDYSVCMRARRMEKNKHEARESKKNAKIRRAGLR